MRPEIGENASIVMARNDHEHHVAELSRLLQRMRRTNFVVERKSGEIRGVHPVALDSFGDLRVVRPEEDVIAAARGNDGHRCAERSGPDDGNLHLRSPIRRSVPCVSREMFEWCFTMMAMAMRMLRFAVQNGAWVR